MLMMGEVSADQPCLSGSGLFCCDLAPNRPRRDKFTAWKLSLLQTPYSLIRRRRDYGAFFYMVYYIGLAIISNFVLWPMLAIMKSKPAQL
jgi:hypothetical protein